MEDIRNNKVEREEIINMEKKKTKKKKAPNKWIVHLMEERKKYPDKKFKEVMVLAKESYKK